MTIVPITWYKGYRVYYLDGDQRSEVPVSEIQGLIAARTDRPGTYLVVYQGTLLQKVSFGISVAAFIYSLVQAVMKKSKAGGYPPAKEQQVLLVELAAVAFTAPLPQSVFRHTGLHRTDQRIAAGRIIVEKHDLQTVLRIIQCIIVQHNLQ